MIKLKTVLPRFRCLLTTGLAALAMLTSVQAQAASSYLNTWNGLYPNSASGGNAGCQLCHGSSTQNINPYGFAMAQCNGNSGSASARIQAIEGQDSDGQGDSNLVEIEADAQPGWTTGSMQVWTRNGCSPNGTNTYPGAGDVDPAAPPVNTAPEAVNDAYSTAFQTPLNIAAPGVLGNDTDADNDPLTAVQQSNPANGTANLNANGSFTYTPDAGFSGTDSFTYQANDGTDNSNTATVTITVAAPGNVPPVANNDAFSTPFQTQLTITAPGILGNDTDADGDTLTAVLQTNVGNGTLNLAPDGGFTYAPNANFSGDDSFTYVANDGTDNSNTATVTITVGAAPPVDACNFSVATNTLAFGSVTVGNTSTLSRTVTNNGSAACSIDVSVTGSIEFALASGTPVNVAPGASANVSVSYSPADLGADSGNLNLTSNDVNNTQNVNILLSGTGVDNVPPPVVECNGELNIDRASWSNRRDRLRVEGDGGQRNAGDFVLSNAFDLTQVLAEGSENDDRAFDFRVRNLDPVPCVVQVEQPGSGRCAIAEVSNAPEDCAPKEPGQPPGEDGLTARGDTYATPVGNTISVTASRVAGVLYNDFGGVPPLTAQLVSGPTLGSLDAFGADGSFTYTPGGGMTDNEIDMFTYVAVDANGDTSAEATVVLQTLSKQTDFKIMMNYELGMHCTGFEFAYCCVLPPYNSIIAQVVKPAQNDPACAQDEDNCRRFFDGYPRMLQGSTVEGLDGLGRETVVNDWDYTDSSFKKYQLRYYHDAQPRQEGNTSKPNTSTLISAAEGNSLQYFNTVFDSAAPDPNTNALVYGEYNGLQNVIQGDGDFDDFTDNYANGWLNHFYIYVDPATGGPNLEGHGATGAEGDKIRLGVQDQVMYPPNSGAALQPLGPTGNGAFENVLTFSADTGTVVFTQAKVLEDLPIMLTSPRIWEALGMPLTPYEDTIDFFADPGAVDEDTVRPYVAMKAALHEYVPGEIGPAVMGSNGQPVIGFGTAPIDIPNCERCHSAPSVDPATGLPNVNSPNWNRPDAVYPHSTGTVPFGTGLEEITNLEINFWMAYYDIVPGVDSTWYPRLKGAAINMLTLHDHDVGTGFTANYAGTECVDPGNCVGGPLTNESDIPQNTRLGNESVICQRCHADNVIASVKSATFDVAGTFPIKPISEAIHNTHRNQSEDGVIVFNDSLGRDGGCQGCHPAHRSDGVMDDYPITLGGNNANAGDDNRLNLGGCFVGRDVHSNPMKDVDGAETPTHLNAIGGWLADNVTHDQGDPRGIWCTNCHTQLGQELWRTEDCNDLIRGDCLVNPRGEPTLAAVAAAVGLTEQQAIDFLDPKVDGFDRTEDKTHHIWAPASVETDANVATIEVDGGGNPVVTTDADGDISVNILSFCTTDDCVARINANPSDQSQWRYPANPFIDPVNNSGAAVPFSAATDGRDHWLSAGEPHCADCHKAPYVEQSGNITPYPPFNYPAKASLMRYTRGHQDISCQGCHESIHGLYPVTPTIDTTSYAQAAALNNDGSHGPLKCEACHSFVDGQGIPNWVDNLRYNDPNTPGDDRLPVSGNFDRAVSWMHTYTDEANPNQDVCRNCHGPETPDVRDEEYLEHAMTNRTSRVAMDNAERAVNNGRVFGELPGQQRRRLCSECHDNELGEQRCDQEWREHLIQGRISPVVWEDLSADLNPPGCGW